MEGDPESFLLKEMEGLSFLYLETPSSKGAIQQCNIHKYRLVGDWTTHFKKYAKVKLDHFLK